MYTEDIRYNDLQLSDSLILTIDRKNSISVTIHAALLLQWVEQTIISNIQIKQTFFCFITADVWDYTSEKMGDVWSLSKSETTPFLS